MFAKSSVDETDLHGNQATRLNAILQAVPWVHAAYFITGGLWSVLDRRSFEAISGPKVDYWLVRTVGGLLTAVGAVIAAANRHGRVTPEIRWLAVGTSGVLIAIDLVYVAKRRISPVYLLDAATNLMLIAGWSARRDERTSYESKSSTVD
jgi:hypothetical protein